MRLLRPQKGRGMLSSGLGQATVPAGLKTGSRPLLRPTPQIPPAAHCVSMWRMSRL